MSPAAQDRALIGACVLVATGGLWLHAGLPGAIAGAGLVALAVGGVDVPYTFAATQVVVATTAPEGVALAVAETGALAVLLVPTTARDRLATAGTMALVLGGGLAVWTVGSVVLDAVWALALVLTLTLGTAAYLLHRIEQLLLGHLDAAGGGAE